MGTTRYEDGQPVHGDGLFSIREAEIIGLLVEQLAVEPVKMTRNANFIDDFGADSLDMVEVVMALEERFNITIADDEADKVATVDDLLDLLRDKLPV